MKLPFYIAAVVALLTSLLLNAGFNFDNLLIYFAVLIAFLISLLVIAGFVGRWLWRKGALGRTILALAVAGLCWQVYDAIYPSDSFYTAEFARLTGVSFPASGKIRFSDASYPDFFGDYTSCALFTVSEADYRKLKQAIATKQKQDSRDIGSDCLARLEHYYGKPITFEALTWFEKEGGTFWKWGLLNDGKSVAYYFISW
jgi:hypothetical protein